MSPRKFVYRPQQRGAKPAAELPMAKGRKRSAEERMNKGETRYAQILTARQAAGLVSAWWYEGMSWRLADETHYRPDFVVLLPDGALELHEVKAASGDSDFGATPEAWVKLKVVAEHAPFPVVVVWQKGGAWQERRV
jgi:hypothetical protein